jgi:hypothetical protein
MRQFPRMETVCSKLLAGSLVTALAVVVAGCPGIPNDGRYQGGSNFRAMAPTDSAATSNINRGDAADTLAASKTSPQNTVWSVLALSGTPRGGGRQLGPNSISALDR